MSRTDRKRSAQRAAGERSSFRRGFTLLEVMAAVALLGILYTLLARVAIEALRAEGESDRRLEAALLADNRLSDSFTGTAGNIVMPELGSSETTEGDFKIALDVSLFQPPVEWGMDGTVGAPPMLFASAAGVPGAQALRTVTLTVSWQEGIEERSVSRTMILVDFERIASIAATATPSQDPSAGADSTPAPEAPAPPSELLELPELEAP